MWKKKINTFCQLRNVLLIGSIFLYLAQHLMQLHTEFSPSALPAFFLSSCFWLGLLLTIARTPPSLHLFNIFFFLTILIQPEVGLYNFSNIRYAEPPVGELRFRASVPPRNNGGKIIDQGKIGRVCPQASPAWSSVASGFLQTYFAGKTFNASAFDSALANSLSSDPPPQDPRVSENCLFLNVIVQQKVFEQASPHRHPLVPVLVWINGGGYTGGEKNDRGLYNPAGLIKASQSSNSTGLVYVAINYRVSFHLKIRYYDVG